MYANAAKTSWLFDQKIDVGLFFLFLVSTILFSTSLKPYGEFKISIFQLGLVSIFFGYSHIFSTYLKVYSEQQFKKRLLLKFSPLVIFAIALTLHLTSVQIFWLVFGVLSIHHTMAQQIGLIRVSIKTKIPKNIFTVFRILTVSLPLTGTLALLADPRAYKPSLGTAFNFPPEMYSIFLSLFLAITIIIVAFEVWLFLRTQDFALGRYIQHAIVFICLGALPIIYHDLLIAALALTISHGLYYCAIVYCKSANGEANNIFFKNIIGYTAIVLIFSFLLLNLLHGELTSVPQLTGKIEVLLATISWSHYNFDAWIWKKKYLA